MNHRRMWGCWNQFHTDFLIPIELWVGLFHCGLVCRNPAQGRFCSTSIISHNINYFLLRNVLGADPNCHNINPYSLQNLDNVYKKWFEWSINMFPFGFNTWLQTFGYRIYDMVGAWINHGPCLFPCGVGGVDWGLVLTSVSTLDSTTMKL